eukprot:651886-Hanusia_phi.AAC.4
MRPGPRPLPPGDAASSTVLGQPLKLPTCQASSAGAFPPSWVGVKLRYCRRWRPGGVVSSMLLRGGVSTPECTMRHRSKEGQGWDFGRMGWGSETHARWRWGGEATVQRAQVRRGLRGLEVSPIGGGIGGVITSVASAEESPDPMVSERDAGTREEKRTSMRGEREGEGGRGREGEGEREEKRGREEKRERGEKRSRGEEGGDQEIRRVM